MENPSPVRGAYLIIRIKDGHGYCMPLRWKWLCSLFTAPTNTGRTNACQLTSVANTDPGSGIRCLYYASENPFKFIYSKKKKTHNFIS
jgi:hypothetical protein